MAKQYGTKAWAKWAKALLEISVELLKEPAKEWQEGETHLDNTIKRLNVIIAEL